MTSPDEKRRPERDWEGLGSPRMWIYIVALVASTAWGVYFIYRTVYP